MRQSKKEGKRSKVRRIVKEARWTQFDSAVAAELTDMDKAGKLESLLPAFNKFKAKLSDRAYWYMLSLIWCRFADGGHQELWFDLFASTRPDRTIGMMKEEEIKALASLPETVRGYQLLWDDADTPLSAFVFSADTKSAKAFAEANGVTTVSCYDIPRGWVIGYFNRLRGNELLVLNVAEAKLLGTMEVKNILGV